MAHLNDLYKYLNGGWFDDDSMGTDEYIHYSSMPKDQIKAEINELEKIIYQDSLDKRNF